MISFLDLKKSLARQEDELIAAATEVIRSGRYLSGEATKRFEKHLATSCGAKEAVGVSNGLDAIRLIFRAYLEMGKLQQGDKVIIPANTYIASILPLTELGLVPLFVEPDTDTLNLDWKLAEEASHDRNVKALLTVHLYGAPCWDFAIADKMRSRGILIIEDNAQAIGAHMPNPYGRKIITGNLGDAAAFSFYPTKNIGAMGDAGAVTSSDSNLISTVRALGNYGSDRRYHNIYTGWNCRLDEIQGAILDVKLYTLRKIIAERRSRAALYSSQINHPAITLPTWQAGSVWHQYVIRVSEDRRDDLRRYLSTHGIATDIHYATPAHLQPCYAGMYFGPLPITEMLAKEYVSLPIADVTLAQISEVATIINQYE